MYIKNINFLGNKKYNVVLSDGTEMCLSDDTTLFFNMYENKILSNSVNEILNYDMNIKVVNKYINLLSLKMYTEREIVKKLKKEACDKDYVLKYLKNTSLIDDDKYTECYINKCLSLTKYGPIKIKYKLNEKGISNEIIEYKLSLVNQNIWDSRVDDVIDKAIQNNRKHSNIMLYKNIYNSLISLGYKDFKIDINESDEYPIALLEFDKLYKKYSKTRSGRELDTKIKLSLGNKGFDYDTINSVMQ